MLPLGSLHPVISKDIVRASGTRLPGLPMLRPDELDGVLAATEARAKRRSVTQHTDAPLAERSVPAPVRGRGVTAPAPSQARTAHSLQSISGTGINPWWRYQEEDIPGGGHVMVNVGTGNVLIQDDDMAIPHKGVALTFRRTYNSQAPAVEPGDFIPWQNLYGTGWTNTFNAHMRVSNALNHKIVYDIDGARYDYGPDGSGGWVSVTPGQHATLVYDGSCGYAWTKKSGTTYYFYKTNPSATGCPGFATMGGYAGRLYRIIGRNRNTYLTFSYSWDNGDASVTGKISAISVQTESGMTAALTFADVSGHRLLQSITFPDGTTSVLYGYDTQGNLNNVSRPPNNAFWDRPSHGYGYVTQGSGGSIIGWADSPRWAKGVGDGNVTSFAFTGSSPETATLNAMSRFANVNPAIPDGTNSGPLQPGHPTAAYEYYDEFYSTGVSQPTFRDSDGHATNWVVDSQGRPTQTQECTFTSSGGCTGTWLVSNETWDTDNNLAVEVDPRGNETDYLYDLMGNTTAVGEPYTTTSQGSFKPTKVYDYDAFNNVVAYCDESETHAMQGDWTPATTSIWPHDDMCATHTNVVPHWSATYAYPSYEPYGELTSMTTPLGYTRTLAYAPAQQGGSDYGLPTSVTGASFTQVDGSTITPAQTFWYDANGYLRCYSKGQGTSVLSYDALGRMTSVADPDDSSANASSLCGKTTGQTGWNTQTTYTYNPDGSVQSSRSPSERAAGVATSISYDVDGNTTSETHHYTCVSSCAGTTTTKWYDGADRLVEVALPHDVNDYYPFPWLTRYIYDLSAGGNSSVAGQTVTGYGNLIKTQEWNTTVPGGSPSWLDMKGNSFDALDRATKKIGFQPGTGVPTVATSTYDGDAQHLGLLTSTRNPEGEIATYGYDERGAVNDVGFTYALHATPERTYAYDPNGRRTRESNTAYGDKTTQYDAAGEVASIHEAQGGNVSSPATISYDYYPDGSRKDLNVASAQLTANSLITYAYRTDGARTRAMLNYGNRAYPFTFGYTDGGRMTSRTDPYTNTVIPYPATPIAAGTRYAPQTWAYDTMGQHTSLGMPYAYAYTGISHDAEGHMYGWHVNQPAYGDIALSLTNSVRGENWASTLSTTTYGQISFSSVSLAHGSVFSLVPQAPSIDYLDPYNGVITATHGYSQHDPYGDGLVTRDCQAPNYMRDTYDRAGRMTTHEVMVYDSAPIACNGDGWGDGYTYDAEDHTVEISGSCVGWGPDRHATVFSNVPCPAQPGFGVSNDTLHYDGASPLFITSAGPNAAVKYIQLEQLGTLTVGGSAAGFVVADREMAGTVVAKHSDLGYSSVYFGSKVWQVTTGATTHFDGADGGGVTTYTNRVGVWVAPATNSSQYTPSLGPYSYTAPDGFTFGGKRFQGVRVMDPVTGHWTSPDVYAGDIHDPMSQKPFMWNRNNPYAYSDPSGYIPWAAGLSTGMEPLFNGVACYEAGAKACARAISHGISIAVEVFGTIYLFAETGRGVSVMTAPGRAVAARNTLSATLKATQRRPPAAVTAGYNTKTGAVSAACSGSGCAEGHVVENLGVDPSLVKFTKAIRPRTGEEVPICASCRQKYSQSNFRQGRYP